MRVHPAAFRREYSDEMIEYYRTVLQTEGAARGAVWRVRFLVRSVYAAVRRGVGQRLSARSRPGDRGTSRIRFGDTLALDFRHALRSLAHRRGFAAAVVAVLAIGMGANTAVFGVLNAVLLRPLPYPSPEQLVRVYQAFPEAPTDPGYVTAPAFVHLRENAQSFESLAAMYTYAETGADVTGHGDPVRVRTLGVTPGYFAVLDVRMVRGRAFGEQEGVNAGNIVLRTEQDAAAAGIVVSSALAESRGVDVGATLVLDGTAREITGILPSGFEDPVVGGVDVLVPLSVGSGDWEDWQWGNHYLTLLGRLRPDVSRAAAQADVERLYVLMEEISPSRDNETGWVASLHDDVVGSADTLLVLLMGAVGFLLLVACVNVASLFLARGAAREREMAVRAALGSPRWRVVRQLLIESMSLSIAGAVAGLLVGRVVAGGLVALSPTDLIPGDGVPFDAAVFGFGALMAIFSGAFFGLAPALSMTGVRIERSLRQGGRSGGQGERESRSRDALVVAQLALSLMLLVGAGLLVRSFIELRSTDLGFDEAGVQTFEVNLPSSRYDAAARIRFYDDLHARISALPGVRSIAAVSHLPVTGRALVWGVRKSADGEPDDAPNIQADQRTVQGDYFTAARIPVLAGRVFERSDDASAPGRAVVSASFAEQMFPGDDAVGRSIVVNDPLEIIGVVGDVAVDARGGIAPVVYHTHRQFADNRNWAMRQVVALDASVPGLMAAARRQLEAIDPSLVLYRPAPLGAVIDRDTSSERFATLLLGAFAGVAVLLAAVGVYGVLAWSVSRRRHEIGVRMALGASAGVIRSMVVRRGLVLAVLALGLGLAGALALTRLLSAFLFGVGVRDPVTFAAASGVVGAVALMASLLPAISATRVNPVSAFRSD
jgi:predicted permease